MQRLAAILMLGLTLATVVAHAQEKKLWAVVMGVSKFDKLDAGQQLQFADKDAEAFSRFIQSPRGRSFPKDNLKLLVNMDATNAQLRTSLSSWLKRNSKPEDVIYIYLATHGMVDKEEPRRTYLLTTEADPEDLYDTTMSMNDLGDIISNRLKKVGRIVLFADACRSGKLGTGIGGDIQKGASQNQELVGLLASRARELSEESKDYCNGHGAFTCYLLKGLGGEADKDKDNIVTAGELIDYLRENVAKATKGHQTPQEFGEFDASLPMSFPDKPGVDISELMMTPWKHLKEMFASLGNNWNLAASYMHYDFQQAIAQGQLLPPKSQSAWDQYQKMVAAHVPAGELADAKDELAVALENEGQKVVQTYLRGDASPLSARDYRVGAECFARAAELNPDEPKLRAKSRFCIGRALLSENKLADSEKALKESIAIDPGGAYAHNALGLAYTNFRRYDDATREFQSAFERASRWAYPHYNLAIAYEKVQRYREAEDQYKQAIALGPNYAYLYLNLGTLYREHLNRQPDAEKNLKRAIELRPEDPFAHAQLGQLYQIRGDMKTAEVSYRKAIELSPNAADPRMNLASLLIDLGRKEEAEEMLHAAVQAEPDKARPHAQFGVLLLDRGKLDEAEAEFVFVATITPDDPLIIELLGDLHMKQKRYADAAREFAQAAKLASDPVVHMRIDKKLKAAEKQK